MCVWWGGGGVTAGLSVRRHARVLTVPCGVVDATQVEATLEDNRTVRHRNAALRARCDEMERESLRLRTEVRSLVRGLPWPLPAVCGA